MLKWLTATVAMLMSATSAQAQNAEIPAPSAKDDTPGYLVVTGWYKDTAVQQAYQPEMLKVIRNYDYQGAVVGVPGVNLRVLEGGWTPRFMLMARFPNELRVKQFWWSDAYQEVRKIRLDGADLDVIEVDGIAGSRPKMAPGNAYLVFLMHLNDRARFVKEYAPFAPAVVEKHGGQFLARTGGEGIELLEGNWPNRGMVVLEFPTAEALKGFWESAEYKRLSEIRKATGDWSVIEIVQGKR